MTITVRLATFGHHTVMARVCQLLDHVLADTPTSGTDNRYLAPSPPSHRRERASCWTMQPRGIGTDKGVPEINARVRRAGT